MAPATARKPAAVPAAQPAALPEPTVEQMGIAYRHLRNQLWPETLEAAMRHPVFGKCLRQAARNVRRPHTGSGYRPQLGQPGAPVPPTPTQPPTRSTAPRPGPSPYWDRKRAAANDRD